MVENDFWRLRVAGPSLDCIRIAIVIEQVLYSFGTFIKRVCASPCGRGKAKSGQPQKYLCVGLKTVVLPKERGDNECDTRRCYGEKRL